MKDLTYFITIIKFFDLHMRKCSIFEKPLFDVFSICIDARFKF